MASKYGENEVTLSFIEEIAKEGGSISKEKYFSGVSAAAKMTHSDLVTEADIQVENYLKDKIKEKFPSHLFLCEESSTAESELTSAPTWIIDPIDGTMNFAHQNPFYCVSIGFAREKKVLFGVVYAPVLDELYSAEIGKGAFLNGNLIKTSGCKNLRESLIAIGVGSSRIHCLGHSDITEQRRQELLEFRDISFHNVHSVINNCRDMRHYGSTALELCYVACGKVDATYSMGTWSWDIAGGSLILQEANGCVSDMDGVVSDPVILDNRRCLGASTPELRDSLAKILKKPCIF